MQSETIYAWTRLSFPLWHEPRPAFNTFDFVDAMLLGFTRKARRELDENAAKEDGYISWRFPALSEEQRARAHRILEDHYGDDAAGHFRWDGQRVLTTVAEAFTMGNHIQP